MRKRALVFLTTLILLIGMIPTALAASYTGTVNEDDVFFRMKPNTNCMFHCRLDKGDKVTVTGTSGDFYAVKYDNKTGYVMKKFVTLSSSAQKALDASLSKSKYASVTSISKLGEPPKYTQKGSSGEDVEKLQQALKIKGYYKDVVDGKYGNNTVNAVKAYQKAMKLPQTGKADYATLMKLFGKVSYTTVANDPQMKGITKISQIEVPNTTKKGNSGKHVIALQQALKIKGFYTQPIDGKYGNNTVSAVKAFQKSKGLTQDGSAGNDTIKALFGKNAANYTFKTERLDWFNGKQNVIPRGATFEVKDVLTGKVFKVRRWAGANHIDAEPLTASDTATMKAIYGGSWSWSRRAILVKYNGHVYAASMNGMPHGTTTISNNNFNGHFCIHFYNSRTHETNRVDAAHQNAVARAMNATW
ncbi:MAG: hypothetical protein E7324_07875 [Clostridiales bacterium]|nr:hypothetical protein [Clostridiales bacterium]